MQWSQLYSELTAEYEFIPSLNFSDRNRTYNSQIHPIVSLTSLLLIKFLENVDTERLIVRLPIKTREIYQIPLITSLYLMLNDYKTKRFINSHFNKGDRLNFSDAIVEYIEEFENPERGHMIKIRCRDAEFSFPWGQMLYFQKDNSHRALSPYKTVRNVVKTNITPSIVDNLLKIETFGNRSFFQSNLILITSIGEFMNFSLNTYINDRSLGYYFNLIKASNKTEKIQIGPPPIDSDPNIVLSSDTSDLFDNLDTDINKSRLVLIDGFDKIKNNISFIDSLHDSKIKTVILSDRLDDSHLNTFTERGYKIFDWNNSVINDNLFRNNDSKYLYSKVIKTILYRKISIIHCTDNLLDLISAQMLILSKLTNDNAAFEDIWYGLIKIVFELNRTIIKHEKDWINHKNAELNQIKEKINKLRQITSVEIIDSANSITQKLTEYFSQSINPNYLNSKTEQFDDLLKQLLSEDKYNNIYIILQSDLYLNDINASIQAKYQSNATKIFIVTAKQAIEILFQDSNTIFIVSGWFNRNLMKKLLNSVIPQNIELLLYSFEEQWYQSYLHTESAIYNSFRENNQIIKLLTGNTLDETPAVSQPLNVPITREDPLIEHVENRISNHYRSSLSLNSDNEETMPALLVIFTDGRLAFFPESHEFNLLENYGVDNAKITLRTVTSLKLNIGDWIVISHSDKNLIRTVASKVLTDSGKIHLLKVAGLWKKALREEFETNQYKNYFCIHKLLQEAGCKRGLGTIKGWLDNDSIIGPRDEYDLKVIAIAIKNDDLLVRLDEVQNAISQVRGAHLIAAGRIADKIKVSLTQHSYDPVITNENYTDTGRIIDLSEYGIVEILQIDETGNEVIPISINKVNKIFNKEID